ncbi:MAG: DUF2267 domain-containing protein [Candidatus Altiarchaeota archaeon]|nr:DUF2267 domain-containing protein [Candidatus Altiarchaeota archaeon]
MREFAGRVQDYSGLDSLAKTEKLIALVFHLLSARLTIKEGGDLASQLPKELKMLWERVRVKDVDVVKLSREEFIDKVMQELGFDDREKAKKAVKAVFYAIKSQVSEGEIKDVEAQLPADLKQMWGEA